MVKDKTDDLRVANTTSRVEEGFGIRVSMLRREDESGCNAAEVLCVCVCVCSTKQRERERESFRQSFNVKGDNTSII